MIVCLCVCGKTTQSYTGFDAELGEVGSDDRKTSAWQIGWSWDLQLRGDIDMASAHIRVFAHLK